YTYFSPTFIVHHSGKRGRVNLRKSDYDNWHEAHCPPESDPCVRNCSKSRLHPQCPSILLPEYSKHPAPPAPLPVCAPQPARGALKPCRPAGRFLPEAQACQITQSCIHSVRPVS